MPVRQGRAMKDKNLIDTQPRFHYWYDLLPQAPSNSFNPMKIIRFGSPDHGKTGLILDDGRRVDLSAFGADDDERFPGGVAMSIQ
jgi:hypothetical protein